MQEGTPPDNDTFQGRPQYYWEANSDNLPSQISTLSEHRNSGGVKRREVTSTASLLAIASPRVTTHCKFRNYLNEKGIRLRFRKNTSNLIS